MPCTTAAPQSSIARSLALPSWSCYQTVAPARSRGGRFRAATTTSTSNDDLRERRRGTLRRAARRQAHTRQIRVRSTPDRHPLQRRDEPVPRAYFHGERPTLQAPHAALRSDRRPHAEAAARVTETRVPLRRSALSLAAIPLGGGIPGAQYVRVGQRIEAMRTIAGGGSGRRHEQTCRG